jgi:hypothetical protein
MPDPTPVATIPAQEIADLLRRVVVGTATMYAVGSLWDQAYCGNVEFEIDGYRIIAFNDCIEFDYVDHAIAPDGRECGYPGWDAEGCNPVDLLNEAELDQLESRAEEARHKPCP